MYVPKWFEETDLETLQLFVEAWPFATLVTVDDGTPVANHVPLVLNRHEGDFGTLYGHLARGNPQWRRLAGGDHVLTIFHGPHAYISPSTYEIRPAVPTWNYAVVHAVGESRLLDDDELIQAIYSLTEKFEPNSEAAQAALPNSDGIRKMATGVVGFAVKIASIQGKFKLGQNRAVADRDSAAMALLERAKTNGTNMDAAVASMMLDAMRTESV